MLKILCILLLLTSPALAMTAEQTEHANSAILFAEREDWDNARAHAQLTGDSAFTKLITWQYLLDGDNGATFDEYTAFMAANPDWPDQKKLRLRAELSLHTSNVDDQRIISWFGGDIPITGIGKVALAEALARTQNGSTEKIDTLIRDAWKNGDFDEPEEKRLLEKYAGLLTQIDHIARIDRLLWDERLIAAKRILSLAPEKHQKLYKARIGLIEDRKLSVIFVAEVPSALKHDPGLIYDRMRYRARRDDNKGVREMLLAAPAHVPYPEKWWKQREMQIRDAVDEQDYKLATKLLANHAQLEGRNAADALWLQGWLKTEFLGNVQEGGKHFRDMYGKVSYPVSKARAAYWAGRAAEKSGNKNDADSWYSKAADYPTTFYGQLAISKRGGASPLQLPSAHYVGAETREHFLNSDLGRAIVLAAQLGEKDVASRMVSSIAENADEDSEVALAAELGKVTGEPYLGVRAAKKALQRNMVLIKPGYPLPETPAGNPLERPLTLAIIRQESEFNPIARSGAGALGMMQLLPGTAKEIAHKNDIPYNHDRLTDPEYNMTLGSLYLNRLINSYDGSYVMAIAAYNAGPGNVRGWVKSFGTPGNNMDDAVNWIEKIPFSETRNYVQRVLENVQVYRHLDTDPDNDKLALAEDLVK